LKTLSPLTEPVSCTHAEAAQLFYHDQEQGSDRAAGMMLAKLAALGLIQKSFDGNTTRILIAPLPDVWCQDTTEPTVTLQPDDFDPRSDAVPIAQMLASNYNWMNAQIDAMPHRIAGLLRQWAAQYAGGMRVLRNSDNGNPLGFYLLYPTAPISEAMFFTAPHRGLHLSILREVDPFVMAKPGDRACQAVFVRSWMIHPDYWQDYQTAFVQDVQHTLVRMERDFPALCDLYTLIIHPQYEALATALGFQRMGTDQQTAIHWMYQARDRFLAVDVPAALLNLHTT
jgi:hypothetical protein